MGKNPTQILGPGVSIGLSEEDKSGRRRVSVKLPVPGKCGTVEWELQPFAARVAAKELLAIAAMCDAKEAFLNNSEVEAN